MKNADKNRKRLLSKVTYNNKCHADELLKQLEEK